MNSERLVKGIYKLKPLGKRTAGRPKNRWEDYVTKDLKLLNTENWTRCIRIREGRKRVIETVKTFKA
jgi:hypothetical protein